MADFKLSGNAPSMNARLANLAITGAKTLEHSRSRDVGRKSIVDDLLDVDLSSFETSSTVTCSNESNRLSPEYNSSNPNEPTCKYLIDRFYPMVANSLANASSNTVPVSKGKLLKHWWTDELSHLKQAAIDSSKIWSDAGRPWSGAIFDNYAYKLGIRKLNNESDQQITNELHEALCMKETKQFWNIWKSKFESKSNSKPKSLTA